MLIWIIKRRITNNSIKSLVPYSIAKTKTILTIRVANRIFKINVINLGFKGCMMKQYFSRDIDIGIRNINEKKDIHKNMLATVYFVLNDFFKTFKKAFKERKYKCTLPTRRLKDFSLFALPEGRWKLV